MKKVLLYFFAAMGVLFCLLIAGVAYFVIVDPYGIRPLLFGATMAPSAQESKDVDEVTPSPVTESDAVGDQAQTEVQAEGFVLSEAQRQVLIDLGVDASLVPYEVTAVQMECFIRTLGDARVAEIRAGARPSPFEFLSVQGCM